MSSQNDQACKIPLNQYNITFFKQKNKLFSKAHNFKIKQIPSSHFSSILEVLLKSGIENLQLHTKDMKLMSHTADENVTRNSPSLQKLTSFVLPAIVRHLHRMILFLPNPTRSPQNIIIEIPANCS